jgi:hypothetical protein
MGAEFDPQRQGLSDEAIDSFKCALLGCPHARCQPPPPHTHTTTTLPRAVPHGACILWGV